MQRQEQDDDCDSHLALADEPASIGGTPHGGGSLVECRLSGEARDVTGKFEADVCSHEDINMSSDYSATKPLLNGVNTVNKNATAHKSSCDQKFMGENGDVIIYSLVFFYFYLCSEIDSFIRRKYISHVFGYEF